MSARCHQLSKLSHNSSRKQLVRSFSGAAGTNTPFAVLAGGTNRSNLQLNTRGDNADVKRSTNFDVAGRHHHAPLTIERENFQCPYLSFSANHLLGTWFKELPVSAAIL
ncbi:hypothetical protein RRG08_050162 [Elysia crispata]|uniref:Uncharacterized protein n=1 Tax=Elysia crispata TaxID=231223 RepID=A0AAE1CWJ3_9GAST|nr:hypothetical protein RRG08_050162 [Elysia crispata]